MISPDKQINKTYIMYLVCSVICNLSPVDVGLLARRALVQQVVEDLLARPLRHDQRQVLGWVVGLDAIPGLVGFKLFTVQKDFF